VISNYNRRKVKQAAGQAQSQSTIVVRNQINIINNNSNGG
jgi:hypothetical protein